MPFKELNLLEVLSRDLYNWFEFSFLSSVLTWHPLKQLIGLKELYKMLYEWKDPER